MMMMMVMVHTSKVTKLTVMGKKIIAKMLMINENNKTKVISADLLDVYLDLDLDF